LGCALCIRCALSIEKYGNISCINGDLCPNITRIFIVLFKDKGKQSNQEAMTFLTVGKQRFQYPRRDFLGKQIFCVVASRGWVPEVSKKRTTFILRVMSDS
jgi:hypothetical protein